MTGSSPSQLSTGLKLSGLSACRTISTALLLVILWTLTGPHQVMAGSETSVLRIRAGQGPEQRVGSGFYIQSNILATSFQLVRGAETITAGKGKTVVQVQAVLTFDPDLDLALLYTPARGAPLPLDGHFLEPWSRLQTMGFAQGESVQKVPVLFQEWERFKGIWHLRIQGPVPRGMSGGPVVNDQGRVVGMVRYVAEGKPSSLAWAVDSKTIHRLFNQALDRPVFTRMSSFARQTGAGPRVRVQDQKIIITDE